MLECIRNREKQAKKKSHGCSSHGTPTKRQRLASPRDELLRRYPARVLDTIDDTRSLEQHKKAMDEENKKAKPRDSVLVPLMKSTFSERRMYVQSESASVVDILEMYPALSRPAVVSNIYISISYDTSVRDVAGL